MRKYFVLFYLFLLLPFSAKGGKPEVQKTSQGIELRNDCVSIILSEEAEMVSCIDLSSNVDIAARKRNKIASLSLVNGDILEAKKVSLDGNTLKVHFDRYVVDLEVCAYDHYFTVEVQNDRLPDVDVLSFWDLRFAYDYTKPDIFLATAVAMSLQTDQVYYPSGENKKIQGRCTAHTGIKGAKLAVVACNRTVLRDVLKEVYLTIPNGTIPVTTSGGPFALDNDTVRMDCLITTEAAPEKVSAYVNTYLKYGVRQLDFHESKTFIQGDFSFRDLGTALDFKKYISDPFLESGILSSMHTYSYFISYRSDEILSNPRWQQQLEFRAAFKLNNQILATDKALSVSNDKGALAKMQNDAAFRKTCSPYLLIDREIVKYSLGRSGQLTIQRGQCGTEAVSHKKGTEVRVIGGYYSHIAPQPGTELFYEIAHRTAKAYNEGGFRGIYFDAFDALQIQMEHAGLKDYTWYYGASFVNEVLKYCKISPFVEYATTYPSIWAARGRGGTLDSPNRGYKNFIDDHLRINNTFINRFYVTTLGWFNLYPEQKGEPWNYSTKYVFSDDIDYLGTKAIAYDQTITYGTQTLADIESSPGMQRNYERYYKYNLLRTNRYFSDKVISIIKDGKYEYKLEKKGLKWGFYEVVYCREKIRDIGEYHFKGENPFKKQKPFIRLVNMYSSDCKTSIPLMSFNESKEFTSQKCEKAYTTPIDLSGYRGIRVKVKGNGTDSSDAICIRIASSDGKGFADYVLRLSFDGWKDIILTDLDNAENPDLSFDGIDDSIYNVHRYDVDLATVNSIKLYKSGECKGVMIKSIEAVPLKQNSLKSPTVHLGAASVRFDTCLESGEYLEYKVGDRSAVIYDYIGKTREVKAVRKGRFRIPSGSFTASVSGEAEVPNAPSQVTLTFGLYGKFIKN